MANSKYTHCVKITDPNRDIENGLWSEHSRKDLADRECARMKKRIAANPDAAHFQGVTFWVEEIA